MFDVNDILARLAAGEDIADIAQQAADALNEAKNRYDLQEQKRKEEERLKKQRAAEFQKKKEQKALEICNAIFDYGRIAFPEIVKEGDAAEFARTVPVKDLCETLDLGFSTMKDLGILEEALKGPKKNDTKAAEDAIAKFLTENGLF